MFASDDDSIFLSSNYRYSSDPTLLALDYSDRALPLLAPPPPRIQHLDRKSPPNSITPFVVPDSPTVDLDGVTSAPAPVVIPAPEYTLASTSTYTTPADASPVPAPTSTQTHAALTAITPSTTPAPAPPPASTDATPTPAPKSAQKASADAAVVVPAALASPATPASATNSTDFFWQPGAFSFLVFQGDIPCFYVVDWSPLL